MTPPSRGRRAVAWGVAIAVVLVVALAVRGEVVLATVKSPAALLRVGAIVAAMVALSLGLRRFVADTVVRGLVMAVPTGVLLWLLVVPYFTDTTVVESLPGALAETATPTTTTPPAPAGAPTPTAGTPTPTPGAAPPTTAVPIPATSPTDAGDPTPSTTLPPIEVESGPVQVSAGSLEGIDHRASGSAAVYRLADGSHIVRLEDVDIQNGPDYRLYLVEGAGQESPDGGLDLGALKANKGSHNYPIPAEADTTGQLTVLVWCRAFAVPVANATQLPV